MTWKKLQEFSVPHYYSLALDKYFPRMLRNFLRHGSAVAALASFILSFGSLPLSFGSADGLFFLFIFTFLTLSFLEFFYRSMLGTGLRTRIKEKTLSHDTPLDYSLSQIVSNTDEIDATRAFFETKVGLWVLLRCGIEKDEALKFIHSQRTPTIVTSLKLDGESINLLNYGLAVYDADQSFSSFLSYHALSREEFAGALFWVSKMEEKKLRKERFWSRENLGALPSIGKSWSYGIAYEIGKYGVPFEKNVDLAALDAESGYREKEVEALESILERMAEANALIIDDDKAVARDIVGRLLKKIKLGTALPSVEHKDIVELDWNALMASYKNRGEFEAELLKLINQAAAAGNIILYINDLPSFVAGAKNLGVNLSALLSPYLSGRAIQIVAAATPPDFHLFIETNPGLLEKFERVIPDKAGVEASIDPLLERAVSLEKQSKIFFSYPAVLALALAAERFITYGEMPGKALEMLSDIVPWALEKGIPILKEEHVSEFASLKTGIAGGHVSAEEAEKIANLEGLLHQRVIGQDEAIRSIAAAVRRSRSGVANSKRPLSSFLFIGPTGVGKTEVSKALAENFFGDEYKLIRFDMSEYSGFDALSRLIGDFASGKSGVLASKIRDNPYSVVLLDEFEKASGDVRDLFLQILDEGKFNDALGSEVNARNNIIIATSNAGSSLIWEATRSGADLIKMKDEIIDAIIKERIFKPELVNRFDGVVLFHPLTRSHLVAVAKLGLQKLALRLKKEKNIELVVNEATINFLVEKGSDPQFGARSINRAIQDNIEDLIAKKIISGKATAGSKIEIREGEFM